MENWIEFLKQHGAQHRDGAVQSFGNPDGERRAARTGNVLVDLSHLSLIRASGPDAKTFLNGQLTNDIQQLDGSRSQLSAWCSPKGRMLALFRIVAEPDGYLLQLPEALRDENLKRLRVYVFRSKVTLAAADDSFIRLGVAGPDAHAIVLEATGVAPPDENGCGRSDVGTVLRLPGLHPRFEILLPPARADMIWTAMRRRAVPAGEPVWTWHDIRAGIPIVLPETSDAFVPQMANLDLLGGISFGKGCYTGQEIVARIHYLGRLKQRMYRLHVETSDRPKPGAPVYAPEHGNQATGNVVIASEAPEDGYDLLAVVHATSVDAGELHLGTPDGPRLTIESLPYAVT